MYAKALIPYYVSLRLPGLFGKESLQRRASRTKIVETRAIPADCWYFVEMALNMKDKVSHIAPMITTHENFCTFH